MKDIRQKVKDIWSKVKDIYACSSFKLKIYSYLRVWVKEVKDIFVNYLLKMSRDYYKWISN
ncbi:hypothetical protein, partial [Macellibacteroides fermentans]|uniref:hypothetical protein n=1 Tax=Macellibacteroides fermentans TaxID=879969 RepID=UPI00406C7A08